MAEGAPGQGLAGLRANWGDLETWARAADGGRETEMGLGLQVSGPNGTSFIAFIGRVDPRASARGPATLSVQVAPASSANPNVVRRASLVLTADERGQKSESFDLSGSMTVDDPSPGGTANNGVARLRADDFLRLARAKTVGGNVFGFDFEMRTDQVRALQALADRLHLVQPKQP